MTQANPKTKLFELRANLAPEARVSAVRTCAEQGNLSATAAERAAA